MQAFTRGQKSKLADLGIASRCDIEIMLETLGHSVDIACFGLDSADHLSDDRYMVFYNQLASPERAVTLTTSPDAGTFRVDLDALPASIVKLVFTATLSGADTLRSIGRVSLRLGDAVAFTLRGADFNAEKAVMLAELYRRDGQWRFGALGQGFDGGLAALLRHFGGVEAGAARLPASSHAPAAAPAAPRAGAPAANKVSLSKITLDQRGDKVSLEKQRERGFGRIHVNLNWNQQPSGEPARGLFGKLREAAATRRGIDLDLGCLYELADGTTGVVQALGNAWGRFETAPFVALDGDDRTGTAAGGENVYINGDRLDAIRRVLVFAFIYRGVANWAQTDGVVTVRLADQPPVEVRLDNGDRQAMCAIAMLENRNGRLQVTKLAEYVAEHRALDAKYGFGLRWTVGSKG
jgi:tellurite resistance protein TerA